MNLLPSSIALCALGLTLAACNFESQERVETHTKPRTIDLNSGERNDLDASFEVDVVLGPEIDQENTNVEKPEETDSSTEPPTPPEAISSTSLSERLYFNGMSSPIWTASDFEGDVYRNFGGNWLWVNVKQKSKGGMDTAIELSVPGQPVENFPASLSVQGKLSIFAASADANWWYGPKISVGWNSEGPGDGASGWYENYIIDAASQSPEELENLFLDYFEGEKVATTEQDGSTYKHYLVPFREWYQFWSIRQDYRLEGSTDIGKIVKVWRDNGLPNKRLDGVKFNIETHNPQELEFMISHVKVTNQN